MTIGRSLPRSLRCRCLLSSKNGHHSRVCIGGATRAEDAAAASHPPNRRGMGHRHGFYKQMKAGEKHTSSFVVQSNRSIPNGHFLVCCQVHTESVLESFKRELARSLPRSLYPRPTSGPHGSTNCPNRPGQLRAAAGQDAVHSQAQAAKRIGTRTSSARLRTRGPGGQTQLADCPRVLPQL